MTIMMKCFLILKERYIMMNRIKLLTFGFIIPFKFNKHDLLFLNL